MDDLRRGGAGGVGGGAVCVCSLACNPGIFIILGAAMLQGFTLWMAGMLMEKLKARKGSR